MMPPRVLGGAAPAGGGRLSDTAQRIGNLYLLHATASGWQGAIHGVTGYGPVPLMASTWVVCLNFS
jgi:hypothetical protein